MSRTVGFSYIYIYVYIYIIYYYISAVRMYSVNASSTLLTRTLCTPIRAGGISKRTRGQRIKTVLELCGTQSRRVLLLSSNPEFTLSVLDYKLF